MSGAYRISALEVVMLLALIGILFCAIELSERVDDE